MSVIWSRMFKDISLCRTFLYKSLVSPNLDFDLLETLLLTFSTLWKDVISPERKTTVTDSEFVGILRCLYYMKSERNRKHGMTGCIESDLKWQKPTNAVYSLAQIGFGIANRLRKRFLQNIKQQSQFDDIYCLHIVSKTLGWSWSYHECLGKCLWPLLTDLGPNHVNLSWLLELIGQIVVNVGYVSVGPYHPSIRLIRERLCASLYSTGKLHGMQYLSMYYQYYNNVNNNNNNLDFPVPVKQSIVQHILKLLPHKTQGTTDDSLIRAWLPLVIWWKSLPEDETPLYHILSE